MIVQPLTELHFEFLSLTRGCTGSSESTDVKIPHCWKSHVTAQLLFLRDAKSIAQNAITRSRLSCLILTTPLVSFSRGIARPIGAHYNICVSPSARLLPFSKNVHNS